MHAYFRLQLAINILAVDFEGDGFNARPFAFEPIGNYRLKIATLSPVQLLSQQHLRPLLAFGAARAWVDGDNGIAPVVFSR